VNDRLVYLVHESLHKHVDPNQMHAPFSQLKRIIVA